MPKDSRGGTSGGVGKSAISAKMPELKGSEKQVAWAEDIRSSALKSTDSLVQRTAEGPKGLHAITANYVTGEKVSLASAKTVKSEIVDTFQATTSAKAIIDARNNFTYSAIEKLMASEQKTGAISKARKSRSARK